MIHRGEIVTKVLTQKNVNKSLLAERMGLARNTLYKQLEREDMSVSHILHIGKLLNVDFAKLIPEITDDLEYPSLVNEPLDEYRTKREKLDISVSLDGTDKTLQSLFAKLEAINDTLKKFSQVANA